jgi:glycosyltransferase involved in cell wall biosynthesis
MDIAQNTQAPAVSVIIPTYRRQDLISQTLESVFSQTFRDFEVVVVNDGSPDRTEAIIAPLAAKGKIRYFAHQNAGQSAARNHGAIEARGKFFAFLDDDDLWPPDKLEWQVRYLEENPHVGVVAGGCETFLDKIPTHRAAPIEDGSANGPIDFILLARRCPIESPGQTLIRCNSFRELGGFDPDPDFSGAEDYDFWLRALRRNRIELVARIALFHRRHPGNASNNADQMFSSNLAVAKRHLCAGSPTLSPEAFEAFYDHVYEFAGHRVTREWACLWSDRHNLWSRLRTRRKALRAIRGERRLRRLFLHGLVIAVQRRLRPLAGHNFSRISQASELDRDA